LRGSPLERFSRDMRWRRSYVLHMEDVDQTLHVRELERTVAAMRAALELKDREASARDQRELADAVAEAAELRATVSALREQLESEVRLHVTRMQEAERLHRAVVRELEQTVQALRLQLEQTGA
jgi:UDP-N-acetylglucosamine enolpyruvyl transferase